MTEEYNGHGVRFRYPEMWELTEQAHEDGVTLTLTNPNTSSWTIQLFGSCPAPEHVISQAIEAFQQEYEEVDLYPIRGELCDRPLYGTDIEFVCLELINSAFVRSFQTDQFTVLVLYQGTDVELEETRDTLVAITESLRCVEDAI